MALRSLDSRIPPLVEDAMPTDNNSQGQVSQAANGSNIRQLVNSTYIEALTGEALNPVAWPKAGGLISVARMLRASSSPVPFEDRSGILDSLIAWAHQDHGFSVQVIGGAGGTGKTRLGVELCRRLSAKPDGETQGGIPVSSRTTPLRNPSRVWHANQCLALSLWTMPNPDENKLLLC